MIQGRQISREKKNVNSRNQDILQKQMQINGECVAGGRIAFWAFGGKTSNRGSTGRHVTYLCLEGIMFGKIR